MEIAATFFSTFSIQSIAFFNNQAVNPIAPVTLPLQAFHKLQEPVFEFIR